MPALGRGGAGNILAAEQETSKAISDLESNTKSLDSSLAHFSSTQPTKSSTEDPYAFAGRGGAGNLYSPAELHKKGTFHDAATSNVFGDGTPAPLSAEQKRAAQLLSQAQTSNSASVEPPRTYGRGGAGNYVDAEIRARMNAEQKAREDEKKSEIVSAEVERGVNETLAAPEKARLSEKSLE